MRLPITRYYGSKRKLINKIWEALNDLQIEFDSVLDLFGGTGVVSYFMAQKGKHVVYNDIFSFNPHRKTVRLGILLSLFLPSSLPSLLVFFPSFFHFFL